MTTNKAAKRAVRARMAKTGERYTTARHFLLDLHLREPSDLKSPRLAVVELVPVDGETVVAEPTASEPAASAGVAAPGMSDAAIRRGTGRGWEEWFALLDAWGAREQCHRAIARHLATEHGVGGWWAQSLTVGYERARGLRAIYERPDGFSVNVSKTVPVPVERLFAAVTDEALRDRWLEPGTLRLRSARPNRSARFDVVGDGTRLSATFLAKGEAKASVQLEHDKLQSAGEVERRRAEWRARLDRLAGLLAAEG